MTNYHDICYPLNLHTQETSDFSWDKRSLFGTTPLIHPLCSPTGWTGLSILVQQLRLGQAAFHISQVPLPRLSQMPLIQPDLAALSQPGQVPLHQPGHSSYVHLSQPGLVPKHQHCQVPHLQLALVPLLEQNQLAVHLPQLKPAAPTPPQLDAIATLPWPTSSALVVPPNVLHGQPVSHSSTTLCAPPILGPQSPKPTKDYQYPNKHLDPNIDVTLQPGDPQRRHHPRCLWCKLRNMELNLNGTLCHPLTVQSLGWVFFFVTIIAPILFYSFFSSASR